MSDLINLTQLRGEVTAAIGSGVPVEPLLALIDTAEAAMVLANEEKFLSPAAYDRLRETLARYTTEEPM